MTASSSSGGSRSPLPLVVAARARLAIGDLRLGLHRDEDQLCNPPACFEDERLRPQVLQLQGDVPLESRVAPAGQGVVDPDPAEGRFELQVAGHVARNAHVLHGRGEHDLAGEELDVGSGELLGIAGRADPVVADPDVVAGGVDLALLEGGDSAALSPSADPVVRLDHGVSLSTQRKRMGVVTCSRWIVSTNRMILRDRDMNRVDVREPPPKNRTPRRSSPSVTPVELKTIALPGASSSVL